VITLREEILSGRRFGGFQIKFPPKLILKLKLMFFTHRQIKCTWSPVDK